MREAPTFYTLRDDTPDYIREMWPGGEAEPMSVDDIPTEYVPHDWQYGGAIRTCSRCGEREAYWDDEEYPDDPCRQDVRPFCDGWVLWRSIDHGLRAADETMALEVCELANLIMGPVIFAMARAAGYMTDSPLWFYGSAVDAWTAFEQSWDYDGSGWCDPTDDDPDCERIGWAHEEYVFYRQHDDVPTVLVETSADAGMTWLLVRDGSWNR